jgi:hypothetical protein
MDIDIERDDKDEDDGKGLGLGLGGQSSRPRGRESVELTEIVVDDRPRDPKIVELRQKLVKARADLDKARNDFDNPGWGTWVKYAFVTASGRATSSEVGAFLGVRLGVLSGLSSAGFAIAYLLPALQATEVLNIDNASNSTTTTQHLTDVGNYEYYWGNTASYGWAALVGFGTALTSLATNYRSMRERILADAQREVEKLEDKVERRQLFLDELAAAGRRNDALEKSLREARQQGEAARAALEKSQRKVSSLRTERGALTQRSDEQQRRLEAATQAVTELQLKLSGAAGGHDALTKELERARTTLREQESELTTTRTANDELEKQLATAQRESELKSKDLSELESQADRRQEELRSARGTVELQTIQIQTLEAENQTSRLRIGILEAAAKGAEEAEGKLATVTVQLEQLVTKLEQTAQQVTPSPRSDQDGSQT